MLWRCGSIAFAPLAVLVSLDMAWADAGCPEFCDRANAFSVSIPSGWTSFPAKWEAEPKGPTPELTLHMVSPSVRVTGANCPVVSVLAASFGDWARNISSMEGVRLNPVFWKEVLNRAEFTLTSIKNLIPGEVKNAEADDRHLISYVEFSFRTRSGKPLKARQALFWLPAEQIPLELPPPDDLRHIPGRLHFVNCTARQESFDTVIAPFKGVFKSFRTMYCFSLKGSREPECRPADDQTAIALSPTSKPATVGVPFPQLADAFDDALLNAAARAVAGGEQ